MVKDKSKQVTVDFKDIAMAGSVAIANMPEDLVETVGARDAMCMLTAVMAELLINDIDLVRARKEEAMADGED